jgi:hypothetical protein
LDGGPTNLIRVVVFDEDDLLRRAAMPIRRLAGAAAIRDVAAHSIRVEIARVHLICRLHLQLQQH